MVNRCEAKSLEGFVQQLAVGLVSRGYWFYVTGWIPERKDPRAVDEKLGKLYGGSRPGSPTCNTSASAGSS
jgi:hypothetical protein